MNPPVVLTAGGAGQPERIRKKQANKPVATTTPPAKKQQNTEHDERPSQRMEFEPSHANTHQPSAETSTQKKTQMEEGKTLDSLYEVPIVPIALDHQESQTVSRNLWLFACFLGIMVSFVAYGLLLEYATSGGRKLHELSFLFVTSGLYTLTAAAGRHVRDETPTSIPPARFAVLGLTSMGSTFCSVRSLRYVIYPIQVLAKSCKPVPVMLMGAIMGKTYPLRKYINVAMIVAGVALFMGGGSKTKNSSDDMGDSASQLIGLLLLFISLCFDGGTGAYEDKLMAVHHVGPFDLMYNIQLGKTILAGVGLVVLNQVHEFVRMCEDMGFLLIALGLSGALGQVFIFVTIAKFGALTCSIIGLARKVTTLVASILFFGHSLSATQFLGLLISVGSMVMNFWGKKNKKKGHGHAPPPAPETSNEEIQKLLDEDEEGGVELQPQTQPSTNNL
jgi:solute carrier family 35 (UDP-galactose transporter), member B1